MDATALEREVAAGAVSAETEEEVLRWLAGEYGLTFTTLENIEPDRALLSKFSARILLKEELLPLTEKDGVIEVAAQPALCHARSRQPSGGHRI